MFIQFKNIGYYNFYIYKLKLTINYLVHFCTLNMQDPLTVLIEGLLYALKSLHHAGAPSEMLPYKIVKNNKCLERVHYYLNTILLWPVYYGN